MKNNGAIQAGIDNTVKDTMGLKSPGTSVIHTFGNVSARRDSAEETLVLTKSEVARFSMW